MTYDRFALDWVLPAIIAADDAGDPMNYGPHLPSGVAGDDVAEAIDLLIRRGYLRGKVVRNAEGKPMVPHVEAVIRPV